MLAGEVDGSFYKLTDGGVEKQKPTPLSPPGRGPL